MKLILLFSLVLLLPLSSIAQPLVSNVRAVQQPGSGLVDIDYDLASPAGPCTVTLLISADGGASFNVAPQTVSGHIGTGITPGTGRRITWNAGMDWPGQYSAQMRFRVIADDGEAASAPVITSAPSAVAMEGQFFRYQVTSTPAAMRYEGVNLPPGLTLNADTGVISGTPTEEGTWQVALTAGNAGGTSVMFVLSIYIGRAEGSGPEGMVLVEGGTIAMSIGTNTVSTFYIGRYEVTWDEWQTVREYAAANGYDIGSNGAGCSADHPVHSVAWFDALKWSNAKSEKEGLTPVYTVSGAVYRIGEPPDHTTISQNLSANGYRLPLETEWEFAARGGNQTNGYTYAGFNYLNAVGWYRDNSDGAACDQREGRGTWPVGQKMANELGLYDMSGNVWEWCWDLWSDTSSSRYFRGGSWNYSAGHSSVSSRSHYEPETRWDNLGFRLARTPSS